MEKGSDDKYHIDIGIWGTVGNSYHTSSYLLCIQIFKDLYQQFEFAIATVPNTKKGRAAEVLKKSQTTKQRNCLLRV